ncbi:MAG: c-type cytochrome, partial [Planctomycetales bacterium]|nr:c-type cytochrome [Planctomycetales bacterium]
DPRLPSSSPDSNWLLVETLAWLESPNVAAEAMELLRAAPAQEEQMQYARSLRMLKSGWTPALRNEYFEWFLTAANYRGGASFERFIEFIRNDAVATLSEDEKQAMAELLARKPERTSALEHLGKIFDGRESTKWTLDELSTAARAADGLRARDFHSGQKMFAAAGCYACHRFGNQGGMTGPDLTSAGRRYSAHDLLDQIVNPSKVINDQFSAVRVVVDGQIHTGVVVNLNGDSMTLNTDLADPNQRVNIDRKEIERMEVSKVSPMPEGLLNRMKQAEILDLIAYVLSGGDEANEMFR